MLTKGDVVTGTDSAAEGRTEIVVDVAVPLASLRHELSTEGMMRWLGPEIPDLEGEFTPRTGGSWWLSSASSDLTSQGTFASAEPDHLVLRWTRRHHGRESSGLTTFTFALTPLGTQVRVVVNGDPAEQSSVAGMWERVLRRFAASCAE